MSALGTTTPILRIFDVAKAHEFYLDFLGFEVQWEHRFEGYAPLYTEVSRDGCVLHLSEHHGDATPGAAVRIRVEDIAALHRELIAKAYRFARPGGARISSTIRALPGPGCARRRGRRGRSRSPIPSATGSISSRRRRTTSVGRVRAGRLGSASTAQ
jgi:catechol 2,3-dioxygenase-like lactoylglutathione lyase family enzyme